MLLQATGWSLTVCPPLSLCSVEADLIVAVPSAIKASTLASALYNATSTAQFQVRTQSIRISAILWLQHM